MRPAAGLLLALIALAWPAGAAPPPQGAPQKSSPKGAPAKTATAKPTATKPAPSASPADLADQLGMLAFDANPLWGTPARETLSRWVGPMRLLVFGKPEDGTDAKAALAELARPTGLSLRTVAGAELARTPPNAFLVVDPDQGAAFNGPFREMLRQAFLDDEREIDAFITHVAARQPCWALPVWADPARRVLKAGVIGIDPTPGREAVRACMHRAVGGLLGLLGPGAFLTASAFAPAGAPRLSRDDERMLRALYGRALKPGMDRASAQSAAAAAFAAPARAKSKAKAPAKTP